MRLPGVGLALVLGQGLAHDAPNLGLKHRQNTGKLARLSALGYISHRFHHHSSRWPFGSANSRAAFLLLFLSSPEVSKGSPHPLTSHAPHRSAAPLGEDAARVYVVCHRETASRRGIQMRTGSHAGAVLITL